MIVTVVFAYVHAYRNRGEGYIPPVDSDRAASGERQKLVKWTVHSSHRNWSSEPHTLPTETGQVNCTLFPQKLVKWSTDRNWSNQQNTLQTDVDLWAEHSTKRNWSSGLNSLSTETGPVNRTLYRQKTDPWAEHSTERNWSNELNALLKEIGQLAHSTNRNPFNRTEHPVNTQKLALWTATLTRKTGRLS